MAEESKSLLNKEGVRVHVLGIGGMGTSALAQMLLHQGAQVSGEDREKSIMTELLEKKGVKVSIQEEGELPAGAECLVFSDAVPEDNQARRQAKEKEVPQYSYAEALGYAAEDWRVVAVAGSHGKSTTTALTGLCLSAIGMDPAVIVGTKVPQFDNTNFKAGKGKFLVVEADEYRNHFGFLKPHTTIITNIDYDHVDSFPTPASYLEAFTKLIANTSENIVLWKDDPNRKALVEAASGNNVALFGIGGAGMEDGAEDTTEVLAENIVTEESGQQFSLNVDGKEKGDFSLPFLGDHYVIDATAALASAFMLGDVKKDVPVLKECLKNFQGTWRRFELVGFIKESPVVSDYAHHPAEIRALLSATRSRYPDKRIYIAFQPHQGARTKAFSDEFIDALSGADEVLVCEVYDVAGREEEKVSVKEWADRLTERGTPAIFARDLESAEEELVSRRQKDDVILVVGAGSVDKVARRITER